MNERNLRVLEFPKILEMLADGQSHHVSVLHSINLPYILLDDALQRLVDEEVVVDDDGMLSYRLST